MTHPAFVVSGCAVFCLTLLSFVSHHTGDAAHSLATRVAHILTAAFPQLASLFPGGSGNGDFASSGDVAFFRAGRARLNLDETRPPSAAAAAAAQRARSAADRVTQV